MRARWRHEGDDWQMDGAKITEPEALDRIRQCLNVRGPVILEHWFYRGSCSPDRMIFEDFEELTQYLETAAFAGDAIHIWDFAACCKDGAELAHGKCPDENGLVPRKGAY